MATNKNPSFGKEISRWSKISHDYARHEFSYTSFSNKRDLIVNAIQPGLIVELGCGSLGLLLRDISQQIGGHIIACDFSVEMIRETREKLGKNKKIDYVVADNNNLPIKSEAVDTVISINSILPERRSEIDRMFEEIARVLTSNGRLIAILPAFEMSLLAQQQWGMNLKIDFENHREFDAAIGVWQCYYTVSDINELMKRYRFSQFTINPVIFSSPAEMRHVLKVYGPALDSANQENIYKYPLFEHILIANK